MSGKWGCGRCDVESEVEGGVEVTQWEVGGRRGELGGVGKCYVGSCDVRTIAGFGTPQFENDALHRETGITTSRVTKRLSRPPTGGEAPVLVWWGPILLRRRSAGPDAEDKPHLSLSLT